MCVCSCSFIDAIYHFSMACFFSSFTRNSLKRLPSSSAKPVSPAAEVSQSSHFSSWTFGNKGRIRDLNVKLLDDRIQAIYGKTTQAILWILGHSWDLAPSCSLRQFSLDLSSGSLKLLLSLGQAMLWGGFWGPSKEAPGKRTSYPQSTRATKVHIYTYTLFSCWWLSKT